MKHPVVIVIYACFFTVIAYALHITGSLWALGIGLLLFPSIKWRDGVCCSCSCSCGEETTDSKDVE